MADETENVAPGDAQEETTDDLIRQVLEQQKAHRAEVEALREQINRGRQAPRPQQSSVALSAEELAARRADEIAEHSHYCPGCGRLYDYQRECVGRGEAPHPAIEVVSTDELKGDDPSKHTVAPGVAP